MTFRELLAEGRVLGDQGRDDRGGGVDFVLESLSLVSAVSQLAAEAGDLRGLVVFACR
ncbi:hypothetical protein AB0D33_35925 [Streptomyces sp. NPDC048404]|uniref:hypothetical protein n=1 Tax=unclassified Streptomyces TaxID=2593676 RepID=UPI00342694C2